MKTFKKIIFNDDVQNYEALLSYEMSELLNSLIRDDKIYKIKNKTMSLQTIVFEFFDTIVEKFQNNPNQNNLMGIVLIH